MGFIEDQQRQWEENAASLARANLPFDPDLWKQAERSAGHISLAAMNEEYDRLLKMELSRKQRGFFARLFGW
jgi:hypothetical protein